MSVHREDGSASLDPSIFRLKLEKACRRGNVEAFFQALHRLGDAANDWDDPMRRIAGLPHVHPDIQHAFLNEWSTYKRLSYRAHQDPVVARALRMLLPKSNYAGPALRLFRGARLAECRQYGFGVSWTKRFEIARFYCGCASSLDAVVLAAVAPPGAVLQQRRYRHGSKLIDETMRRYGEEDEYIVDPSMLTEKRVVHREPPFICGGFRGGAITDHQPVSDPIFAAIAGHRSARNAFFQARAAFEATIVPDRPAEEASLDQEGAELWTEMTAAAMVEAERELDRTAPTTALGTSALERYRPARAASASG
jgi:hypothetical protein